MRFLLDQGLPRSSAAALQARGHVAEHVGTLGMATATDADILEAASARGAVAVTLDADFHMLLAIAHATGPSVIRIRIEGLNGDAIAGIVHAAVLAAEAELRAGAAISVTASAIRVRRLPLV
jgi:predicted nuclease of predicted toxin-antitoxin system